MNMIQLCVNEINVLHEGKISYHVLNIISLVIMNGKKTIMVLTYDTELVGN